MQALQNFLRPYERSNKQQECTHTSMSPKRAYSIPRERISELYGYVVAANETLRDARDNDDDDIDKLTHALIERPNKGDDEVSIFRLDVDIKQPSWLKIRCYTTNNIEAIVKIAWDVLDRMGKIKRNKKQMFVFEKTQPTFKAGKNGKDAEWGDGIHFMAPNVHLSNKRLKLALHMIREAMIKEKVMDNIIHTNKMVDVIDLNVPENSGWTMYGGCKPGGLPYLLTRIYGHDMSIIEPEIFPEEELVELLSIRRSKKTDHFPIRDEMDNDKIDEMLTEFDDDGGAGKRRNEKQQILKKFNDINYKIQIVPVAKGNLEDIERAKKVSSILSRDRADSYYPWLRVGWALHNISYTLLDTWILFSKKSKGYKPGECEKLWTGFRNVGYGMAALCRWAKKDDPKKFIAFSMTEFNDALTAGLSGTTYDVAKVLYEKYKDQYVCASIRANEWYEFRDHRYIELEQGSKLMIEISEGLVDEYCKLASCYYEQASLCKGLDKEKLQEKADSTNSLIKKLKSYKFKKDVMSEASQLFFKPKFKDNLDENYRNLHMVDGVYDLDAMEMREGVPEDNGSYSTNNKYMEYDEDNPKIRWVLDFLKTLQPNERVREYLVGLLASCLDGFNREEKFHLFTGSGCFEEGTMVLMADGTRRPVEKIRLRDNIMGWDSKPRTVMRLIHNKGEMYRVQTDSSQYRVSADHKLVFRTEPIKALLHKTTREATAEWLERTENQPIFKTQKCKNEVELKALFAKLEKDESVMNGDIVVVKAHEFVKWAPEVQSRCYSFQAPLSFDGQKVPLDPGFFGRWIAKGSPSKQTISGLDNLDGYVKDGHIIPEIAEVMDKMHLFDPIAKRIPQEYLMNSTAVRESLLENLRKWGRKNSDNELEYATEELAADVALLARSLGHQVIMHEDRAHSKWRLAILNNDQWDGTQPVRVAVDGKDNFYGFELGMPYRAPNGDLRFDTESDESSKFMLADLTVASNSNGKSKLVLLMQQALGDYAASVPPTVFTKKRGDSNAASPQHAKLKAKRAVFAQETEEDDKLAMGVIKEYTGGDYITVRPLYKDPVTFKPQFKLFMVCNKLPTVPANDEGTWRRLRVVEFKSKFCANPDAKKQEYMIDGNLTEKIMEHGAAFLSVLINRYKIYKTEGLYEPEEVKVTSNAYRKTSDVIMEFIEDSLEKKKRSKETLMTVFKVFQNWFKTSYGGVAGPQGLRCPTKRDFQDYLEKQEYTIKGGVILGVRIRDVEFGDDME
jgi:P4 family phage/plasmid primase-like protien